MTDTLNINLDTCHCCETGSPIPQRYNPPGQPSIAYRLSTHAKFLRRMLSRLSMQEVPDGPHQGTRPLTGLTTRSTDDLSIALLDAWAMVADVLAFYQERIANEGYLRTATERRSVLELARTIGYELNPGVAASTFLAFQIEKSSGKVTIPQGTKVQSIPAPGKLPQTFETSADISAKPEWNVLPPRLTRPQELALKDGQLYLLGLSAHFPDTTPDLQIFQAADFDQIYPLDPAIVLDPSLGEVQALEVQQIYLDGTSTNLKAGDPLLLVGKNSAGDINTCSFPMQRVEADSTLNRTRVDLSENPPIPTFAPLTLALATVTLDTMTFNAEQVQSVILGQAWSERSLNAFLAVQGWDAQNLLANLSAPAPAGLPSPDQGVFAFRERAGFFGNNAPLFGSLPKGDNLRNDPYAASTSNWDAAENSTGRTVWTDSWGTLYPTNYPNVDVFLERSVSEIVTGSWVLFKDPGTGTAAYRVSAASDVSVTGYGLSAKATGLKLSQPDGTGPDTTTEYKVRRTTAYARSESLDLAQLPIEDDLSQGDTSLMLNGLVLDLKVGQPLALSGEQADAPGVTQNEVVILADIVHQGGFTTLNFKDGLKYSYTRKTVTLNANVARATHGETVREVLGSGDGSQANQSFVLKKPPLTYVSAPTPSGGESTLTVRVNGVEWVGEPSLYGLDGRSQDYITRIGDGGKTTLTFGDGHSGARLPTGTENIQATYRSGIGLDGEVDAGSLTLLQTRPLGVWEVTNPVPASGAAAPETRDSARTKAPLRVLTMDRIVSLLDFEDFARSFSGIGKAKVVVLWNGENSLVHITIATASGKLVDPTSDLYTNLVAAIDGARDPVQQVRVDTFQPLFFNLKAKVMVDSRLIVADVLAQVEAALQAAFAFDQRAFGQPATSAEVISTIQNVPGVVAVDLEQLYLVSDPNGPSQTTPATILPSTLANWPKGGSLQLAQLLLINPVGIILEKMA